MNYLSFDVGIKNLAYCIITSEKDIVDFNYGKDWDKVNLYLFKSKSTIKCLKKYITKL